MPKLTVLDHHTVYRNADPNLRSEYVAFPAIQALPDDSLLCMCRHGVARESDDGIVLIHRSTDGGATWQPAGALPEPAGVAEGSALPGGFGLCPSGAVLAWARYPCGTGDESGQIVWRSSDGGLGWSQPTRVATTPFGRIGVGGNLVTMADGTMISVSEWGGPDRRDGRPQWVALLSRSTDDGRSWSQWVRVHESDDDLYYFDLRATGLPDGRLLAVYWTHDMEKDEGVNVHTAWSSDQGETWTAPQDAGFWGQVTDIASLQSGRVLAVTNHRREPLGIRAVLSEDGGKRFAEDEHVEVWGIDPARVRSAPVLAKQRDLVEDVLDSYHFFTFGTPSITQLSDGVIVVAFYVTEEQVTYVRCCRMREF